jgi:ABC-type nickel/cobalt efflux system permease component RcnA
VRLTAIFLAAALLLAGFTTTDSRSADPVAASVPQTTSTVEITPVWDHLVVQLYQWQQRFHRELTNRLRDISADGGGWATWSLILASFLYGVFHAAGPGHGKVILSAYLLTHREAVRRGVALAFAASFCQGLVALAVVYGLVFLAGLVMNETQAAVRWTERASFVMVALMGAWLVWRGFRLIVVNHRDPHGHHHADCGHDHAHAPDVDQTRRAAGPLAMLGLVLSIGLRPCSGAVVVLVFAQVARIPWTGVAAVVAMSLGAGFAVALLAFVAVNMRALASRMSALDSRVAAWASGSVGLAGGLLIALLGLSLLSTSFAPMHPMGL